LVEETIPVPLITTTDRTMPDCTLGPFETAAEADVLDVMRQVFAALIAGGLSKSEALLRLAQIEPFGNFPPLLQLLREENSL
jgi:hypothetical protein